MSDGVGFEPSRYLTKIQGSEYLEVRWRLVWFRDANPEGGISTEMISIDDKKAVFKATVSTGEGGFSTGYGSETPGDFRDYIEKAETKAIGRALAALGYGTQFAPDFAGEAQAGRPVDAPVGRSNTGAVQAQSNGNSATDRQLSFMYTMMQKVGFTRNQAEQYVEERYPNGLTKAEAASIIEFAKANNLENPYGEGESSSPEVDQETGEILEDIFVPKSGPTQFWEKANSLGLKSKKEVSDYLGYDISNSTDFSILLRSLKEKEGANEHGIPF